MSWNLWKKMYTRFVYKSLEHKTNSPKPIMSPLAALVYILPSHESHRKELWSICSYRFKYCNYVIKLLTLSRTHNTNIVNNSLTTRNKHAKIYCSNRSTTNSSWWATVMGDGLDIDNTLLWVYYWKVNLLYMLKICPALSDMHISRCTTLCTSATTFEPSGHLHKLYSLRPRNKTTNDKSWTNF